MDGSEPIGSVTELTPDPRDEPPAQPDEVIERTGCVDIVRSYASQPPAVMLLIDQSGSMSAPFGNGTRWSVLRDAIIAEDGGLLSWLDTTARVGLMLYSSLNGFEMGFECPLVAHVESAFGNAEAIRTFYQRAEPIFAGDTPTAEGIDFAASALLAIAEPTTKYILLLTDGDPDTCRVPDPQNGLPAAVEAAQRAFNQGVRVYTVGVSPDFNRLGLQWMANAGAGKPRNLEYGSDAEAEEPLSASTDPAQLASQLKGVIGDVRSCEIELDEVIGAGRAFEGRLELDGQVLEYRAMDGWSFVDDDTVLIHGASCDRILADGERLEVHFPCLELEQSPR